MFQAWRERAKQVKYEWKGRRCILPAIKSDVPSLSYRAAGALLGLAAGDALGATVEFMPPGTFEPVTEMVEKLAMRERIEELGRALVER